MRNLRVTSKSLAMVAWTLLLLAALSLGYAYQLGLSPTFEVSAYLLRDIQRSQDWLAGNPIWLGSDMTGGAFTFGPFFYFLLFPVTAFGGAVAGASKLLIFYHVAAQVFCAWALSRRSVAWFLIVMVMLTAGTRVMHDLTWLNNASLITAACLSLLSLSFLAWHAPPATKQAWLCSLLVALALCWQIHLSLGLLALILFWVHRRQWEISRRSAVLYAACLLLPLLPSLCYLIFHWQDGLIVYAPKLEQLLYGPKKYGKSLLEGLEQPLRKLVANPLERIEDCLRWALFGLALIAPAILSLKTKKKPWACSWGAMAGWGLFLVLLASMPWILREQPRYLRTLTGSSIFWLLVCAREGLSGFRVLLGLWSIPAVLTMPTSGSSASTIEISVGEMNEVVEFFNSRKIPYDQFRRFSYEYLSIENELSLSVASSYFTAPPATRPPALQFILIDRVELARSKREVDDVYSSLPIEIRERMRPWSEKKIYALGTKWLVAETALRQPGNSDSITNIEELYRWDALRPPPPLPAGTQSFEVCALKFFCHMHWRLKKQGGDLAVWLDGRSLAAKWELPPAATQFEKVSLSWQCGNKKMSAPLAERIGTIDTKSQNSTLAGPFLRSVAAGCENPSRIKLRIGKLSVKEFRHFLSTNENLAIEWREGAD